MADYKETIFLPKTSFSMKGNLPQLEPRILEHWKKIDLYQKIRAQSSKNKKFILHMGPPYANGHLHIGHALTGILKDMVVRSYQMLGYDSPLIPGWDCHGLPIEWKIEEKYRKGGKKKEEVPLEEFRAECRAFAEKWIDIQRQESIRLGMQADWDHPYITMTPDAEARIVEKLFSFLEQGSLYKGFKPVMWSVVEKTALAEAEIEYHDHQSNAVYVRFPVARSNLPALSGASVIIWTTTPWSLPGNRAIAYASSSTYALLEALEVQPESLSKAHEKILLAQDRVSDLCQTLGINQHRILHTFEGKELEGTICAHPLAARGYTFDVPLFAGHHVTTDAGTGLVHIAPGHGPEDFEIGNKHSLEIPDTIADDGFFKDWVPVVAQEHVFKADTKIIDALKEEANLLHMAKLVHSYPHSWRSKAPLIYRTTPQFFISMDKTGLRDTALKAIEDVNWYPAQARNRIRSMVEGRPDWCLSRQRAWGVPLPLFIERRTGNILNDKKVNSRIIEIFRREGCDAWFNKDPQVFLGQEYNVADYDQVKDILDVWFESGATQGFVLEARPELAWPADLYLEGSDQHRGWFQSSLLIGCGTHGRAPFKSVVTHGFVLDDQGHKLSKSAGNGIAPQTVIDKNGAELLRLWVAFSNYHDDSRIGPEILKHLEDIYRRFRNTLRYLLGALEGFTPAGDISSDTMPELEKWVLHRLAEIDHLHRKCLQQYDFLNLITELHHFCAVDLSAFYFDIRKDSVYCDALDSQKRQAVQTIFHMIFERLVRWLAPFLCFTAEEAWLTRYPGIGGSIHLELFNPEQPQWLDTSLSEKIATLRLQRRVLTGALEKARSQGILGSSLQAHLHVFDPAKQLFADVDYAELAIVSDITICHDTPPAGSFSLPEVADLSVVVANAEGEKCQRCWKILPEVGKIASYPDLCERCHQCITQTQA